jgi:hypothetical protein
VGAVWRSPRFGWISRSVESLVNSMSKQSRTARKLPDFSGKVVSAAIAGDGYSRVLVHPRWEVQGGRLFLIGAVTLGSSTNEWCAGLPNAVAWDAVTDYLVFDSPEHYSKRLAIHDRKKRKS